jgi:hypothetical protein
MKITGKALRLNNGALIHKEYYAEMRKIIDEVSKKVEKEQLKRTLNK